MPWLTITVDVPEELKDAFVGEFSRDRILGVWEKPAPGDQRIELVLYFDEARKPPLVEARVGRLFERNGYPVSEVRFGVQEQEDWTREWRKGYTSFPIGDRFQVVPSWEKTEDVDAGRMVLGIDPGLAFGTGTHETTQLMLESLEVMETGVGPLVDLGTGSGILTIAAAKLGFAVVAACDLDTDALHVTRENLRRNGVDVPVFVGSIDALRAGCAHLILANLTCDVIEKILAEIDRTLIPGGLAVLSGILDSQLHALRETILVEGFEIQSEVHRGEWVAMKVKRGD
jgi:ribosomal protein L11 methyltransferase